MVHRVDGIHAEVGHLAGFDVYDVHVGVLALQPLDQLEHVKVGGVVLLDIDVHYTYFLVTPVQRRRGEFLEQKF